MPSLSWSGLVQLGSWISLAESLESMFLSSEGKFLLVVQSHMVNHSGVPKIMLEKGVSLRHLLDESSFPI